MLIARPIVPKQFRTAAMRAALLNALKLERANLQTSLQATVSTWNHKVTFSVGISYKGDDARLLAWTDDYVWNLLDKGTAQRFYRSDPQHPYRSKTRPRVVGSFAGGGLMVPSRRRMKGIVAREWTQVIVEMHAPIFNQRIVAAIAKGFR